MICSTTIISPVGIGGKFCAGSDVKGVSGEIAVGIGGRVCVGSAVKGEITVGKDGKVCGGIGVSGEIAVGIGVDEFIRHFFRSSC